MMFLGSTKFYVFTLFNYLLSIFITDQYFHFFIFLFFVFITTYLSSLQLQTYLPPYSLRVYYTPMYDVSIFLVSYNKAFSYNLSQEMPATSTYYTTDLCGSYIFFAFVLFRRCFTGYVLQFLFLFTHFRLSIF